MQTDYILKDLMVEIERHRQMLTELQDTLSSAISDSEIREDAWLDVALIDRDARCHAAILHREAY